MERTMAHLTIRKLDQEVKEWLRREGAEHDTSMEEYARRVLGRAYQEHQQQASASAYQRMRRHFEGLDLVRLELPERQIEDDAPDFSDKRYDHS